MRVYPQLYNSDDVRCVTQQVLQIPPPSLSLRFPPPLPLSQMSPPPSLSQLIFHQLCTRKSIPDGTVYREESPPPSGLAQVDVILGILT